MLHLVTLQIFEQLRTPLLTDAMVGVTALGSVAVAALIIYTLYHFGRRREAVLSLVSVTAAGLTAKALKVLIARPRPDAVSVVIQGYPQSFAFPSGHAAVAFALATVLELELEGSNYYFFLLAALVAVSRLYLGLHYPGDVVAGALIGLGAGYAVHRSRERILGLAESTGFKG